MPTAVDEATFIPVSARRVDLTPTGPVTLGCSEIAGDRLVTRIAEPLEADLIVLGTKASATVLLSLDTLYPVGELRAAILAANPSLTSDRLLIAATHTHQAPMLVDGKPRLGIRSEAYAQWLCERLTAEVTELLSEVSSAPATARWEVGETMANHSINRRRPTRHGMRQAPNKSGPRDEKVTVILLRGEDGPVAVLWNYACHTVGHPDSMAVSAGFPHQVRERLRAALKAPDLPIIYLQGFSGDVRPSCTTRIRGLRSVARTLKWGPSFHETTRRSYGAWCASLADRVVSAMDSAAPIAPMPVSSRENTLPLDQFIVEAPTDEQVRFQYFGFGHDLAIVAVSAELVSEYADVVRGLAAPAKHLVCVGCTDDAFGYIPTRAMLSEGGYEAGGFCTAFGHRGVQPSIEETTLRALRSTIPTTMSPPPAL